MSKAQIAVLKGDDGFIVEVHARVHHKHLGPARDIANEMRDAFEDHAVAVELEDMLLAETHPHLFAKTDPPETSHAPEGLSTMPASE